MDQDIIVSDNELYKFTTGNFSSQKGYNFALLSMF